MLKVLFSEVQIQLVKIEKPTGQKQLKLDGFGLNTKKKKLRPTQKQKKKVGLQSIANCVQGCHTINSLR